MPHRLAVAEPWARPALGGAPCSACGCAWCFLVRRMPVLKKYPSLKGTTRWKALGSDGSEGKNDSAVRVRHQRSATSFCGLYHRAAGGRAEENGCDVGREDRVSSGSGHVTERLWARPLGRPWVRNALCCRQVTATPRGGGCGPGPRRWKRLQDTQRPGRKECRVLPTGGCEELHVTGTGLSQGMGRVTLRGQVESKGLSSRCEEEV